MTRKVGRVPRQNNQRTLLADIPFSHSLLTNAVWGAIAGEGTFWIAALLSYVKAQQARTMSAVHGFWTVAALLTLAWFNNITAPQIADVRSARISGVIFFGLVIVWAYWMDRRRHLRDAALSPVPTV